MEYNLNLVKKALKFIEKRGLSSGCSASAWTYHFAKWNSDSVAEQHEIEKSIKALPEGPARKRLAEDLQDMRVRYKYELKRRLKRRREMKAVLSLYAWFMYTYDNLAGHTSTRVSDQTAFKEVYTSRIEQGVKFNSFSVLMYENGGICPQFILVTPYKYYGKRISLFCSRKLRWMEEALEEPGFELYGARMVHE